MLCIGMPKTHDISQTKEKITSFLTVTQNSVHTNSLGEKICQLQCRESLKL